MPEYEHLLAFHDTDTENDREEQFVFLKQWAAHIPIDAIREVFIQVLYSLI